MRQFQIRAKLEKKTRFDIFGLFTSVKADDVTSDVKASVAEEVAANWWNKHQDHFVGKSYKVLSHNLQGADILNVIVGVE